MLLEQGHLPLHLKPHSAFKIISLVPSISWYLQDLCEKNSLIGITKFCIPQDAKVIPPYQIGGTKTPDLKKIIALQPDLILANKEENNRSEIETLASHFPVYVSSVSNLEEMYQMMRDIGWLCHREQAATQLIQRLQLLEKDFRSTVGLPRQIKACYLIWRNPYMTVGRDTFIHSILDLMGVQNVFEKEFRYPTTSLDQIIGLQTQHVFLPSEPFPFKEKHLNEFLPLNTLLVNGQMFSWYGSYMERSFSYLKALNLKLTKFYE